MDVDRIACDPKYAPAKRKSQQKTRSVRDLFADVDQEPVFKDKRGRPWVKNPRAYAKAQVARKLVSPEKPMKEDMMSTEIEERRDEKVTETEELVSSGDDSDDSNLTSQTEESTSSESDADGDPFEVIADLQDADWYELTKDAAPATNIGKRLALLHFDWDNAKAENIYMVLESFLPPRGHIECVTIYPSEFGIKRMTEEAIRGPQELVDNRVEADGADDDEQVVFDVEDRSGWRKASTSTKRRIRQYQLARLKYFYAIIEFDSAETAEAVYNACDGFEYESSGAKFDLRFVDDKEEFSVPPEHAHLVSECREINKAKYTPRPFETSALHRTRIGISWDKTPAERTCWLRDQFKPEVDPKSTLTEDRDELEKYLALSSSGASTAASSDVDEEPPAPTVPRIHRHRPKKMAPEELRAALLSAINSDPTLGTDDEADTRTQKDRAQINKVDSDEEEEEEEEVFNLNQDSDVEMNENEEQYELGPVQKKASKHSVMAATNRAADKKTKKVRRRVLPEAVDDQPFDSSASSAEEPEPERSGEKSRKRKYKEKQRNKILAKKRKLQDRLKRQSKLWRLNDDNDSDDRDAGDNDIPVVQQAIDDDRFDQFLVDPAFKISQTHPDYKEAVDFLRYMRRRKASRLDLSVNREKTT